jgi:hypothetical protein
MSKAARLIVALSPSLIRPCSSREHRWFRALCLCSVALLLYWCDEPVSLVVHLSCMCVPLCCNCFFWGAQEFDGTSGLASGALRTFAMEYSAAKKRAIILRIKAEVLKADTQPGAK